MNGHSHWMRSRMRTTRGAMTLALLLCAAAPARAQEPDAPRCTASPNAADTTLVRYDCAGRGDWARVRFSVSVPAGWAVSDTAQLSTVTLVAGQGTTGVYVQGSDQLFIPTTPRDTANFWISAGDVLLDRVLTQQEVGDVAREAGTPDGARLMITRAQSTDSALAELAGLIASDNELVEVVEQRAEMGMLGGLRAGTLHEVLGVNGWVMQSEGRVTVSDAVLYGLVIRAPQAEFQANRALWDRVIASFTLHPPQP